MRRAAFLPALLLLLAVLAVSVAIAPASRAQTISVGTVTAAAGTTASVPLVLASQGKSVAAVSVDLTFTDPLSYVDVTISTSAAAAGKEVHTVPTSGGITVAIFGANEVMIPDGTVATVRFSVYPAAAPGSYPVNAANAQGADLSGTPVAVSQSSGAVVVGGAASVWILPSSARVTGANGAFWTTDLVVANTGGSDGTFTLKFLGHDADGRPGPQLSFSIPKARTTVVADVLSQFGITSGYGAIFISATVGSLAISGQTSTPGVSCVGGTFGQSVPAVASADLITPGKSRSIVGVREDGHFHTNLILANGGQAGCDVNVTLVLGTGAVSGTKKYTLQPLGMTQISYVARDLGATGDVTGARLIVSPATSAATVAAYASVIDNATNDPRTLVAQ